ncbi:nucleotide-diphospho-sugar transferase [Gloeopeniophorella convolvens]|nr:nucleotide-diphospho-sugar transferase [Gloeopeniophorella convolvens]
MRLTFRVIIATLVLSTVAYFTAYHLAAAFPSFSLAALLPAIPEPVYDRAPQAPLISTAGQPLANATFVVLCRNSDMLGILRSMQQMEDRFNRRYGYPWVFLNNEPFTKEFQKRVSAQTDAPIQFGTIPREHWEQPDWIDEERAAVERKKMAADVLHLIPYGGSLPYRNMCRFNSGFFFQHELLKPYKYYWRVEPDVKYFCDVTYDPFAFMEQNNKTYGFTMGLYEYKFTILSLWDTVKDFMRDNSDLIPKENMMGFVSDDAGKTYNMCHFWSNFEIADMDFWRSEAYTKFFTYLDWAGGFYYERWGDAPVHSIAASLFLRKEQTHFFEDLGYRHEPLQVCPQGDAWLQGRCSCDPKDSFVDDRGSCIPRWKKL